MQLVDSITVSVLTSYSQILTAGCGPGTGSAERSVLLLSCRLEPILRAVLNSAWEANHVFVSRMDADSALCPLLLSAGIRARDDRFHHRRDQRRERIRSHRSVRDTC